MMKGKKNLDETAWSLMPRDFLCPSQELIWARFRLAFSEWKSKNKNNTQKTLGSLISKSKSLISFTMDPNKKSKLSYRKLEEVATEHFKVDPDWLIYGFAEDGRDCWPEWPSGKEERDPYYFSPFGGPLAISKNVLIKVVFDRFRAYISEWHKYKKLDFMEILVRPLTEMKNFKPELPKSLDDFCEVMLFTDYDATYFDVPRLQIDIHPLFAELQTYLVKNNLSIPAFLRRYRAVISKIWSEYIYTVTQDKPIPPNDRINKEPVYCPPPALDQLVRELGNFPKREKRCTMTATPTVASIQDDQKCSPPTSSKRTHKPCRRARSKQ